MIAFINAWVTFTLVLFYAGPIDWPGAETPTVALYVLACLLLFDLGYLSTRRHDLVQRPMRGVPRSRPGALAVVCVYSGINLALVGAVTGKSVLSTSSYSLDYGQVYDDYQASISHLALPAFFGVLLLVKAALFPVVLVLLVQRFRTDFAYGAILVVPMVISSLFRGTDLEIIDLAVIIFGIAYLHGMLTKRRLLYAFVAVLGILELFLARRLSRFGSDLPACLPDSNACFDADGWVSRTLGQRVEVLFVFVTNYVTNGYQGLSYAFQLPWTPNWGFGHLPTLGGSICRFAAACPTDSYQQELTQSGWDSSNKWTTAYTVIANDLSFWLVPIFLFYLGVVSSRCLNSWRSARDPAAGAGLVLVLMFWVYSSANMHLAITLDWAVATVVLLYVAPWRRERVLVQARAPGSEDRIAT